MTLDKYTKQAMTTIAAEKVEKMMREKFGENTGHDYKKIVADAVESLKEEQWRNARNRAKRARKKMR